MFRDTMLDHRLGQRVDHIQAVQSPRHADREALPRVLIDQVQHAYSARRLPVSILKWL